MHPYLKVSSSLNAEFITALPNYETHEDQCGEVAKLFEYVPAAINDIYNTRATLLEDKTLTAMGRALATHKKSIPYISKIKVKFQQTLEILKINISKTKADLIKPIAEASEAGENNSEIRAHFKTLSRENRMALLNASIKAGDTETVAAVLNARPYLSGITEDQQKVFIKLHQTTAHPELVERLTLLVKVDEIVTRSVGIAAIEMKKATNFSAKEAEYLRQQGFDDVEINVVQPRAMALT